MAKVIVIIVAGVLFAWYASTIFEEAFGPQAVQKACTMEALVCPDGSSVGRSGPNCEFAQCPQVPVPNEAPYDDVEVETEIKPLPPQATDPSLPIAPAPTDSGYEDDMIACTMDAMQCPDGSYVGRTGPNCQFVCP